MKILFALLHAGLITSNFGLTLAMEQPQTHAALMQAGTTRILSYHVNMTIQSRFARTQILVEVLNEKNCSTTEGFTLPLPLNARVTDFKMHSGQCETRMDGVVKAEEQAKEEFAESASQGGPAALLEAYDTTNYGVQLSLKPQGRTVLEIQLEQLLQQQRGQIDFQVPIYPGIPVDLLTFDLSIDEGQSGLSKIEFVMDYEDVDNSTLVGLQVAEGSNSSSIATAHLEQTDVPGASSDGISPLPRLLRGFYDPGPLPAEGLLIPDPFGTCFVHLFNPDTQLGSLPVNIVFVIDVSGSMAGQKLEDAKAAFAAIIRTLTDADYFAVHTFSNSGVEQRYGPSQATSEAKEAGEDFVLNMYAAGGTNLEEAYVQGIRQVESMRRGDFAAVPVVLVLTDGQPSIGIQDPQTISRNVLATNSDGINAKIYGLAFGDGADFNLLSAISLQNGGRATRIYEGYGDAVTQMEDFYVGNLGKILMTDVNITFDGTAVIDSRTQTQFPLFADGSEVAVRARVLNSTEEIQGNTTLFLGATTTANTVNGLSTWRTEVSGWGGNGLLPNQTNECVQSFAHAKISELMLFRDAAKTLGPEMNAYYDLYSLQNGLSSADVGRGGGGLRGRRAQDLNVVSLVEDEALQLALEAGIVWPGLTAMVRVESDSCAVEAAEDVEVCYDGDRQGYGEEPIFMAPTRMAPGPIPMASATTTTSPGPAPSSDGFMAPPKPPGPEPSSESFGDPHFKTWNSAKKFDYHGICDLVLLDHPTFDNGLGMKIHIRTTRMKYASYIETVAVQIGQDTLEFSNDVNNYLINGKKVPEGSKPTLSGYEVRRYKKVLSIRLGTKERQYNNDSHIDLAWRRTGFPKVKVVPRNPNTFQGSLGLLGQYPNGNMVGRDGETEITDPTDFALEWQVMSVDEIDGPMIFSTARHPQFPTQCTPPKKILGKRLGDSQMREVAEKACAAWGEDKQECIFDVMMTRSSDSADPEGDAIETSAV